MTDLLPLVTCLLSTLSSLLFEALSILSTSIPSIQRACYMSRGREQFDEIAKKIKREIDAAAAVARASNPDGTQIGRRHMLGPPTVTGGGGTPTLNTITPCAACKLLRRRCAEECPFSPYFSPHEPQKFAAVHKVFGASNVSKMLLEVPESQRADAANSLVYEANVRLRDPVYGCMGAISALQQQLQSLQAELNAVGSEILKYRYREAANTIIASTHAALGTPISAMPQATVTASQPQPPLPPQPPSPPPPPPPSVIVSSSMTSMYTVPVTTTLGYNKSISSDRVPYFG